MESKRESRRESWLRMQLNIDFQSFQDMGTCDSPSSAIFWTLSYNYAWKRPCCFILPEANGVLTQGHLPESNFLWENDKKYDLWVIWRGCEESCLLRFPFVIYPNTVYTLSSRLNCSIELCFCFSLTLLIVAIYLEFVDSFILHCLFLESGPLYYSEFAHIGMYILH